MSLKTVGVVVLTLMVPVAACKQSPPVEPSPRGTPAAETAVVGRAGLPAKAAGGGALWFDGENDYLRTNKWFAKTPEGFCVEAWVKPAAGNPFSPRASFLAHRAAGNDKWMRYDWSRHEFSFVGVQQGETPYVLRTGRSITAGGWHHLAASFDGQSAVFYVDGDESTRILAPRAPDWDAGYVGSFIGGDPLPGGTARSFRGQIDAVRVWSVARTGEAIRATMKQPISPKTSGLAGYWSFNEGSGQVARDLTGLGHDAQFGSMPDAGIDDPLWIRSDCPVDGADAVGPAGHSLWFDGQTMGLRSGPVAGLREATSFTVEAWIRPAAPLRRGCIVASKGARDGHDVALRIESGGRVRGEVRTGGEPQSVGVSAALKAGTWQHVALVCEAPRLLLYVDGRSSTETEAVPPLGRGVFFLGNTGDGSDPFPGELDEVRIWRVARTEAQIRDGMHRTVPPTEAGLIAYWRFDEGEGQIARDLSRSGAHAELGDVTFPDGRDPLWLVSDAPLRERSEETRDVLTDKGGALEFDGRDDYVDLSNAPELRLVGPLTIEAWVRPTILKGEHPIVSKQNTHGRQNAFELQVRDGLARLRISDGSAGCCGDQGWWPADGKSKLEPGVWRHVAGVYDMKRISIYLDGVLDGTMEFTKPVANVPFTVKVGMNSASKPQTFFGGQIDEVRIWNRARNQEEILADMNRSLRGDEGGLVGYWTFDEAADMVEASSPTCRVVFDHSGHANHGILGASIDPSAKDPRGVISEAPIVASFDNPTSP